MPRTCWCRRRKDAKCIYFGPAGCFFSFLSAEESECTHFGSAFHKSHWKCHFPPLRQGLRTPSRRPPHRGCSCWAGPGGPAAAEWAPLWWGLRVLCFQLLSCSQGLCSNFKPSRNEGCTSWQTLFVSTKEKQLSAGCRKWAPDLLLGWRRHGVAAQRCE